MNPTFKTSVIAFPYPEQRSSADEVAIRNLSDAADLKPDEIRNKWLKHQTQSPRASARTKVIWAAAASDLSDKALRVLILQLSFSDANCKESFPSNRTITALSGYSERSVQRANTELENRGWVTVKQRRREVASRSANIPEDVMARISSEIMENFKATDANQEATDLSGLNGFYPDKTDQEATNLSGLNHVMENQEATNLSGLKILSGYNKNQEATDLSGLNGFYPGTIPQEPPKSDLRPDSPVTLTLRKKLKEKKRNYRGAESECIQSTRGVEEALPPKVEDSPSHVTKVASAILAGLATVPAAAAATPVEPPAIVQTAPEFSLPECWSTPQARQAAMLRPAEARAQREVTITPDGRLEATGGFRSELEATFPLVDTLGGLLASAVNVRPYMTAIETMQVIRRQFVYLQGDAQRRADRDKAIQALYAPKSQSSQTARVPVGYDDNGRPLYRSR